MREITVRVPSGLRRIPDGETGDRAGWIFYQAHRFLQQPWLTPVQPFDPAEGDYEHMPQLRLADGADHGRGDMARPWLCRRLPQVL